MGYGLKISKPGVDVGTAADIDLYFSSELDSMKTKSTGTITENGTVAHGLPYTPIFFIANGGFAPWLSEGVTVDGTNLIKDNRYSGTYGGTSRYYIFYKQF
jgi:hypothetical protein